VNSASQFLWEQEALEYVRERFPSHEPYRAWTNFEFIADDGSINEVDLLVFSPQGFFLIEIKSHPGRLSGDAHSWVFEHEGRRSTIDNPVKDANRKAKKLRGLLSKQKAAKKKAAHLPFIEALVFCSASDLTCDLRDHARYRVCLRDRAAEGDQPERPGIMAAIKRRECPGLEPYPKGEHNKPMAKIVSQALDQAGVRPLQRHRKVGDFQLNTILDEGPGYQDWLATHVQIKESKRLVRLYLLRREASAEDRGAIERAARREFQILETLQHPGILRTHGFTEHELGPALIFEYDPSAVRLDHFLAQRDKNLNIEQRMTIVRQIAEVIRYAHEKRVIHRALSPRSVLIVDPDSEYPKVRIFNWQTGYREGSTSVSGAVTATSHIDRLVDDSTTAYMAPEAFSGHDDQGEHTDVFSLGALAYYIFSGILPAENGLDLGEKLRETKGLQISAVLNGARPQLQDLIEYSTSPDVTTRFDLVSDFLEQLDLVEEELHAPAHETLDNPAHAKANDFLPGGYTVVRRLGQGSTSIVLLVHRDEEYFVLKAASDTEHNKRLQDEAKVLQILRHQHIVDYVGPCDIGEYAGFLLRPVFTERDKKKIETLADRLRKEGPLHIDLLERFGEDLINVVIFLEDQGHAHRDIKPDNIVVGMVGHGSTLHLVLFDFSLTGISNDNIRAGTTGYLDPDLYRRKRWDLHGDRYAAAVTLYELATGKLPKWGDGKSDPSYLNCEVSIDAESFDASLREGLAAFFQKALRRKAEDRFHNAEQMRAAWHDAFKTVAKAGALVEPEDEEILNERLSTATLHTPISELGLGTRATNALDRANVITVHDLITFPLRRLQRLRGVGNKTRREIAGATKTLRKRFQDIPADLPPPPPPAATTTNEGAVEAPDFATLGLDLLAPRIFRISPQEGESTRRIVYSLLGLEPDQQDPWPSQVEVARMAELTRARVGQILTRRQARWAKDPALTPLRTDIAEALAKAGGVMSTEELAVAVLTARGSSLEEPLRTRHALAVIRAAVEVERTLVDPRYIMRRNDHRVLIAQSVDLAEYALKLGKAADALAAEDPLATAARVVERLRAVRRPAQAPEISDARLVRLAAATSQTAAVSSRQELYPRGMAPGRALKLAQLGILGVPMLTIPQLQERVTSRYPEAAPLPGRKALDDLLKEAGFDLTWEPTAANGQGAYVSPAQRHSSFTGSTGTLHTRWTLSTGDGQPPPELADARQFEEKLQHSAKDGAFLALLVGPKYYERAADLLCKRFSLHLTDCESLFLDALRATAEQAKVNWDLVLRTDATPGQGDWDKLLLLVRRAVPVLEAKITETPGTQLMVYPGLLARYGQIDLLERLRDAVARRGGLHGLWLLIPGDQPLLENQALPLLAPGQRVKIPKSWLEIQHTRTRTGAQA
jgi:serine/threonine protein kinase